MFISLLLPCAEIVLPGGERAKQPNLIYLNLCAFALPSFSFTFPSFCFCLLFGCAGACQQQLRKETALIRDNEITESLYKETIDDGRKNVVKLENRLDVITKRCGGVMAENAKLREIIDHMLQER